MRTIKSSNNVDFDVLNSEYEKYCVSWALGSIIANGAVLYHLNNNTFTNYCINRNVVRSFFSILLSDNFVATENCSFVLDFYNLIMFA